MKNKAGETTLIFRRKSYSNKKSLVLVKEQTHRLGEQNSESRNRPTYVAN